MKFTIGGTIDSSDYDAEVGAEIWINDQCVFDTAHVTQLTPWSTQLPTEPHTEYKLRFVMKGKQGQHTQLDSNGTVIKDVALAFKNVYIDDLDIDDIIHKTCTYTHNFNGHGNTVTTNFYGSVGCNGTVDTEFFTPIYIWYLENT